MDHEANETWGVQPSFLDFFAGMVGPGRGDFRCKARNEGLAGPERTFLRT